MFKYAALLAIAFSMASPLPSATAAPDFDPSASGVMSYDDTSFVAADWSDGDSFEIDELPKDAFYSQIHDDPYPFATAASGLNQDPFYLDSRFHTGHIYLDRFGANSNDTTNKYGERVVTLWNGEVVVAALVPKIGATSDPTGATGFNIGLVRYDAQGVRQQWFGPHPDLIDPTGTFFVFPNNDTVGGSAGNYISIDDFQRVNGHFYVLATRQRSATNKDVQLIRIADSGWHVAWNSAFGSSKDEIGGGMYFYVPANTSAGPYKVVVVGSIYDVSNNGWGATMTRYNVTDYQGGGTWPADLRDASFTGSNLAVSGCTTDIYFTCEHNVRQVKGAASSLLQGHHSIYISADYIPKSSVGNRRLVLMKTDQNGYLDSTFGSSGMKHLDFYQQAEPDSARANFATGLAVESYNVAGGGGLPQVAHKLYVSAAVDQGCGANIGIAKLKPNGGLDTSFGAGGKTTFGPYSRSSECPPPRGRTATLTGELAKTPRGLAVVGWTQRAYSESPFLAIIDQLSGTEKEMRSYKPTGIVMSNGRFNSVTPFLDDMVYVTGTATDNIHNQKSMVMTARMRADRIFGHGMEN